MTPIVHIHHFIALGPVATATAVGISLKSRTVSEKAPAACIRRDIPGNKSVYKYGRKVHIEYLHGVTLCEVTAK
ncbi:TPA: hypothetical protein MYL13_003971 [Klebsiella variicola subsp. variicola]|nr:hypothetical protein [Klebsiella variicola subsp. variicola]